MNKERRARLEKASGLISDARSIIEDVKSDEEVARDNMPESFQESEPYERMTEFMGILEGIVDSLEEAENQLDEI